MDEDEYPDLINELKRLVEIELRYLQYVNSFRSELQCLVF